MIALSTKKYNRSVIIIQHNPGYCVNCTTALETGSVDCMRSVHTQNIYKNCNYAVLNADTVIFTSVTSQAVNLGLVGNGSIKALINCIKTLLEEDRISKDSTVPKDSTVL